MHGFNNPIAALGKRGSCATSGKVVPFVSST